ncbi:response regulator transcription factor [Rhodoferax sp. BLA1]|uniref:response regulator transcription factor n=1 Tax=Rhodoferax sp. BLA1 TaxID=2576062 RepID=UPI0015D1CB03|nr:response regulator [Rhodoferax sp. BLA1]
MTRSIYIVEDDPSVRDSLSLLLGLEGYTVALFANSESLLKAYKPSWRGCFLIDIRMPDMDGLSLQKHLLNMRCQMPVIVMTGHGDVFSAREAFRAHAVDFLEKPIDHEKLRVALDDAFTRLSESQHVKEQELGLEHLLSSLTPREKEVMDLVVAGKHNREIADQLGISVRTLEVHKSRMMSKLNVNGISQLVRLSLGLSSTNSA